MQRDHGTSREQRLPSAARSRPLQFGEFRFDPRTLELSGRGRAVRLQPQPARLLELLLAHPGEAVSRDAVRRHLWPDEVHVEFDQSMNSCVKRIRVALGDSADRPAYIETLPRIGYRFLMPVNEVVEEEESSAMRGGANQRWMSPAGIALVALGAAVGVVAALLVWRAFGAGSSADDEPERQVLEARR